MAAERTEAIPARRVSVQTKGRTRLRLSGLVLACATWCGIMAGAFLGVLSPLLAVPLALWPTGRLIPATPQHSAGFDFSRLRYRSSGGYGESYYDYDGRMWERWETDHPVADQNFIVRLEELSSVRPAERPSVRDLNDDGIFATPFLYLCDVGWMEMSPEESQRLGEFLRRGGFLWADDFWGAAEWANFESVMRQALPEATWSPVDRDHPLLQMLFPLPALPQIPARDFAQFLDHDPPSIHRQPATGIEPAQLRLFTDDGGNIVAVASFNSDIGDGWEREAYGDWFFERFSSVAYAFGVNVVLYALSH